MEDDTKEGSGGKHWIDRTERAILDASANVPGEQIVKHPILLLKKHVGQLMPFQGTEKKQAKQRRICALSDSIAGEQREEPLIISFLGCFFDRFSQPGVVSFFCKNCGVQCMLGRKVFEEQRFTDTGSLGDLFGGGSGKALCGKQRCRSADQAGLPFMT